MGKIRNWKHLIFLFVFFTNKVVAQQKGIKLNKNYFKIGVFEWYKGKGITSCNSNWVYLSNIEDTQLLDISYTRLLEKNYQVGIKYAYNHLTYIDFSCHKIKRVPQDKDVMKRTFYTYEINVGKYFFHKKSIFALYANLSKSRGDQGIYNEFNSGWHNYQVTVENINTWGIGVTNSNKIIFLKHLFLNIDLSYNYYISSKFGIFNTNVGLGTAF
jgi:hypothetical protein